MFELGDDLAVEAAGLAQRCREAFPGLDGDGGDREAGGDSDVLQERSTRDNCQVAVCFATRTLDGAVAALGEEVRQHPEASPVRLNDPAYVGVAVTSLPGRSGFHQVRTPAVDPAQLATIVRASAGLRRDPAELLAGQVPGLRVAPPPTPGEVA
ncbi:MAG TPA: hypothetical protein VF486_01720 [Actinomycetes bacterium]